MTDWYPSRHAVDTMSRRDISWADVLHVLAAPEVQYVNTAKADTRKSLVSQRGGIFVVTSLTPDPGTSMYAVVTVGLRESDQWTDQQARDREKGSK